MSQLRGRRQTSASTVEDAGVGESMMMKSTPMFGGDPSGNECDFVDMESGIAPPTESEFSASDSDTAKRSRQHVHVFAEAVGNDPNQRRTETRGENLTGEFPTSPAKSEEYITTPDANDRRDCFKRV